ncbi:hypothetical protein GH733_004291 [Mirounga leonina]|nr:hypothetical protein GH733_004291 [Mirounga leonina]
MSQLNGFFGGVVSKDNRGSRPPIFLYGNSAFSVGEVITSQTKLSTPNPYWIRILTMKLHTHQSKEDGVYVFQPHSQPVSCLYFSPANPAHILSLSYDGTLRCGDFSRAIFEEVYRDERSSFSSFDFLGEDASTLIVGHWNGNISLVDRRTSGTSYEKLINSSLSKIRTVHVHPVHRQYFITAGLRIFDSSCISSEIPLLTTIRFQAVWDPKQEDCVIVGSMAHPRRVEIFHETGKQVHSFFGGECLVSVCSINTMHPTRYILAGGGPIDLPGKQHQLQAMLGHRGGQHTVCRAVGFVCNHSDSLVAVCPAASHNELGPQEADNSPVFTHSECRVVSEKILLGYLRKLFRKRPFTARLVSDFPLGPESFLTALVLETVMLKPIFTSGVTAGRDFRWGKELPGSWLIGREGLQDPLGQSSIHCPLDPEGPSISLGGGVLILGPSWDPQGATHALYQEPHETATLIRVWASIWAL